MPLEAAAVLINPSHTCRDLVMAVEATEKGWFDAIDGTCPVSAIISGASHASRGGLELKHARAFFERLWWYDQVVFAAADGG